MYFSKFECQVRNMYIYIQTTFTNKKWLKYQSYRLGVFQYGRLSAINNSGDTDK